MKKKRTIVLLFIQSFLFVASVICLLTTLSIKMEIDNKMEEMNEKKVEYYETPIFVEPEDDISFIVPAITSNFVVDEDVKNITLFNPKENNCYLKYEIHFNDYNFFLGTDFIEPAGFEDLYLYDILKQGIYDITVVLYAYDDEQELQYTNYCKFNLLLEVMK